MARAIDHFESEPCSRCGGSGTYSYTSEWGSTCFKCAVSKGLPGHGWQLTKAGAKAREAWLAANTRTVPVAAASVGDVLASGTRRYRITEIERAAPGENFGTASSGMAGTPGYTHRVFTVRVVAGGIGHSYSDEDTFDLWTAEVALPPEMEPGTDRRAEMKAYAKAAQAIVAARDTVAA